MFNILTEELIRIATASGTRPASVPEVYAALMADEVEAFPALRPHQRHAWHAFLVQLGAMAMHRVGVSEPPADASEWADLIRGLTADYPDDEPWQLVVDDITKPAFMQPPASSQDKEKEYKAVVATPDELDMLVTSKNHDLKSAVAAEAGADDWIFALVTLQTMEGYGGARNYGISRMTSGYGNRPAFSITSSVRPGGHVKRDVLALLEHRPTILGDYQVVDSGIGLLWTVPWDGTESETLTIHRMEPFYIEVCRRVRLRQFGGKLEAFRANSDSPRIYDTGGITGDPWTPVSKVAIKKSETLPKFLTHTKKFGYERIVDGLFSPDWGSPFLLRLTEYDQVSDAKMQLVARGTVRNKGKNKLETWGYHERIIPLRPKAIQAFGRMGNPSELEDIARERIVQIGKIKDALRRAIATFVAVANSSNIKPEIWSLANPWSDKLDEIVDADFFEHLQIESEVDDKDDSQRIRHQWLRNGKDGVVDHAANILRAAEDALPCLSIHRYKARVQADGVFWGRLAGANGLPEVFSTESKRDD